MRISFNGIRKDDAFGSDKYLKLVYNKKKDKYTLFVKNKLTVGDKISRFFNNLFGSEYREISKILNSPAGTVRLNKKLTDQQLKNLIQINKKIKKLNKRVFIPKIALISIPSVVKNKAAFSSFHQTPVVKSTIKKTISPKKSPNELVVDFYAGKGVDTENRTLKNIWAYSLDEKESAHNYIQWLFPATEASNFNNSAPVLNDKLIKEMKKDPQIIKNLKKSLDYMLVFYGFEWNSDHSAIIISNTFSQRRQVWFKPGDHNHLRLTRIMKCLNSFGLQKESKALFACLADIRQKNPKSVSDTTFKFWKNTQN